MSLCHEISKSGKRCSVQCQHLRKAEPPFTEHLPYTGTELDGFHTLSLIKPLKGGLALVLQIRKPRLKEVRVVAKGLRLQPCTLHSLCCGGRLLAVPVFSHSVLLNPKQPSSHSWGLM